jgi:hypothetical protein
VAVDSNAVRLAGRCESRDNRAFLFLPEAKATYFYPALPMLRQGRLMGVSPGGVSPSLPIDLNWRSIHAVFATARLIGLAVNFARLNAAKIVLVGTAVINRVLVLPPVPAALPTSAPSVMGKAGQFAWRENPRLALRSCDKRRRRRDVLT